MSDPFRSEDSERLADIIWWIKGYVAGSEASWSHCPFGPEHVEALRRARVNLRPAPQGDSV